MPSWGVHLGIANKVLKNIDNIDKNLFMFGNVTPDINNGYVIKNVSKIIAHKITHYDGEKDFKGYRRFYIKYAKYIQDPVILGSLTHLMTDYYYNNITYTKKAIWDEKRESIIGVKLNNGKQIKCNKEELRKLKRNDFRIYADYVYKNSKFEDLKFDEKILSVNQIVDEFAITKKESEETIQYINKYINGEKFIIDMCEKHEYLMYTKQEMENMEKECVQFITEFLKRIKNIIIGKTAGFCYGVKEYIESLKKEIEEFDFSNYKVTSIYIGGGTPSYIDSIYIVEILSELKEKLKCNLIEFKDIEITIEVNPGTVDTKKLNDYKKSGINRLSIGLQSTKNDILKKIGRIHTYQEFLEIYKLARETGFKNINIDLMIGIPEQKIGDLKNTLQDIIKLEPEHISVYSLIIEENTPIEKMLENGEIKLPDEDLERNMYWYVKNTLELNGYNHYEISNFAKLGKESRHNLNCWNQEEYIGFGVAAHSYLNGIRFSNTINVEEYIQHIENNRKEENIQIEESQSLEDKKNEFMMLGFRKIQGVDIARFKEKFIDNPIFLYRENLNKLVEEGLIEVDLNHIKLTNKGIDLANLVFEEFVDDC